MTWQSMLMATAVASADPDLEDEAPDVVEISVEEARDIRMLIREQISAFRADDAERAWRLSSRNIQSAFGSPAQLLELIQRRYQPLLRLRQLVFGEWSITPEGLGIVLELVTTDQQRHHVLYLVVKEKAEGWRINGAVMVAGAGGALAEAA